jgi:hypothetical protein
MVNRRRYSATQRNAQRQSWRRVVEQLESRTLLAGTPADIRWTNAATTTTGGTGDTDGFGAAFGTLAPVARGVVHSIIDTYEVMIGSFNYASSSTFYNLTVRVAAPANEFGGTTHVTAVSGIKPSAGTIDMDGGNVDGNPNSDNGWFLDPTPYDASEFWGTIDNAFSGQTGLGSPAEGRSDFYTFMAHEMSHAMGMGSGAFTNMCANTGVSDGEAGTLYAFRGPSIHHLMSSTNGTTDSGVGKHSAKVGRTVNFGGETYIGARDIANSGFFTGTRCLVSNTLALMLKDAYGYSVVMPAQFYTMYAGFNQATGELRVRGGDYTFVSQSEDFVDVWWDGLDFNVLIDVSNDVPGTGALPGAGNLGAFVSKFRPFLFNHVMIDTAGGNDLVYVDSVYHNVTVNTYGGADFIVVGGGDYDANITTGVTVNAGESNDANGNPDEDIFTIDDSSDDLGDDTHTIRTAFYHKPNVGGTFPTNIEFFRILGSQQHETFNIESTDPNTRLDIEGRNGNDRFVLGNPTLNTIAGEVNLVGGSNTDTASFLDGSYPTAAAYSLTNFRVSRAGMANVTFTETEAVNLAAGLGADTITVNYGSGSPVATVAGGQGNDVINVLSDDFPEFQQPVSLAGDAGVDTINFTGRPQTTTTLYGASFDNTNTPTYLLDINTIENLNLNGSASADTFVVRGTRPGINNVINAGDGNDTIYVGSTPDFAYVMDDIDGLLTVNGQNGTDKLVFSDAGSTSAHTYVQTANTFGRAGMTTVAFSSIETVQVIGSGVASTFNIVDQAAGTTTALVAWSGADTINVNSDSIGSATVHFSTSHELAALNIRAGGTAVMDPSFDGSGVIHMDALSIAAGGKLDLADNALLLDYTGASQLPAVQAMINSARNGGAWNGATGIGSSSAAAHTPRNTTLGAMSAGDFKGIYGTKATFAGWYFDDTTVLVKYTYYGDTDFNGKVNFDDYVRTDNGFNNHLSGWVNGDSDANGRVDFDDYVLIDLAFNTQSGTLRR